MSKFFTPSPKPARTREKLQSSIGGIHRTAAIIRTQEARTAVEDIFMNISFKANRAEDQRSARRAKR